MLGLDEAYRSRLRTAEEAVRMIPNGARIVMGLGVSQPPALLRALADRARAQDISDARIYYLLSTAIAGTSVIHADCGDRLTPYSLFHSAVERERDISGSTATEFIPTAFSQVPRLLSDHVRIDTLVTQVAPIDENGEFSLGTNVDYALAASRCAKRVIVEVNRHMPRTRGNCTIPLSAVTAIVEHDAPLVEVPAAKIRPEDSKIAEIIAGLVDDRACLQMGIGAVPDATCAALRGHRNLGIHTELMTPGLTDLIRCGAVDNSCKATNVGKSVFTFAMGDKSLYDFLDDNPSVEAHPVDYVNSPSIIASNAKVVSVNSTIEVDLDGACNSEAVRGRQFSGSGGQLDFVRGAYMSPGGRSIIACHSTAANGTLSRIVPRLSGPVTTPRNDVHIIVTEYGAVDLKGLSLRERAHALIDIAHPRFREVLSAAYHDRTAFHSGTIA